MARGELTVYGDDVLEALTVCNSATNFERQLNNEGHTLAELIADRVLAIVAAKLALKLPESD